MRPGFLSWVPMASVACALMAPAGVVMAGPHDALIAKHSAAHGVPESLVRRVIHIESRGNPRVVSKGNYGLMQIRLGTAKSMGYRGSADGLLDADTNMTYAVKYLASAYRAAGCNEQRAINYYQRGFYKKSTSRCALPRTTTQVANVEPAQRAAAQRSVTGSNAAQASADLLQPRVVQVQTITRPKSAVQSSAAVPPSAAPVQVATAPVSAPAVAAQPAARAPAVAAPAPVPVVTQPATPQTVARAPEQDSASPPQSSPALPTVFMELLPMPKPRPARAPQAVAKLDAAAVAAPVSQTDASSTPPDTQIAKLDSAAVPLPQPRPESKAETEAAPERESKPARRGHQRHTRVSRKKPEESGLVTLWKKLTTPEKPVRSRRASRSSSAPWLQNAN